MTAVGSGARIGAGSSIGTGCSIGRRVTLGSACTLHANVIVYDDVEIGSRVILHSGSVIGADGFGFVLEGGRYQKFPQIGPRLSGRRRGDRRQLLRGPRRAGCHLDREGTKLDNMVHVAHNCRIGRHVVIAAQTGSRGASWSKTTP